MSAITDVVDEQLAAYRRRDIDGFLSCYAPEIQICGVDGSVRMDGLEVMRERYGQLFDGSPELAVQIANRIVIGDHVIDEERITGFHLPGYPTELHSAVVYQLRADKIVRVILVG
jgi:uncharacterized protein (TIGR02246 family)